MGRLGLGVLLVASAACSSAGAADRAAPPVHPGPPGQLMMAAALLKAMDDGLKNNLDPGPPEERNIYQAMEAGKQVKKLPMTLGDALEALKKDDVIRSAMPGEMYRLYDEYKRDEWERFLHTSTEWDLKMYLDCLP